jgi:hypothetical protein
MALCCDRAAVTVREELVSRNARRLGNRAAAFALCLEAADWEHRRK